LGTGKLGLYIRDGVTPDNHRLPAPNVAMESTPIYVDCQITNGWNADPASDGGTKWYRVRWPESANKGSYWAYGGYLFPAGSNGAVPTCP
jgi:hypothetical protein